MARNEEKQQGRLNRLWLQKEREEGRLKDVLERRPKLSTLNSASSVKKWIPSIKSEIEYYLQQSQLFHYPERKIAEFQLRIEALEKEYKSFMTKLRILDPSCKHSPWTLRAYCKRRADTQEAPSNVKTSRPCEPYDWIGQQDRPESDVYNTLESTTTEESSSFSKARFKNHVPPTLVLEASEVACSAQDLPLSFDHTRLSVAAAAYRGPSAHLASYKSQKLAQMLQSSLPNLNNTPSRETFSLQNKDREKSDGAAKSSVVGQKCTIQEDTSGCEASERIPQKPPITEIAERSGHVLGLDCYSSSDEDCHT
ncbi:uncharacterized protein ACNS7B_004195 [Menidia menidia]